MRQLEILRARTATIRETAKHTIGAFEGVVWFCGTGAGRRFARPGRKEAEGCVGYLS